MVMGAISPANRRGFPLWHTTPTGEVISEYALIEGLVLAHPRQSFDGNRANHREGTELP